MGFKYIVDRWTGKEERGSCKERKYMLLVHLLIEALVESPLGLRLCLGDSLLSAFNNLKGSFRFLF